MNTFEERCAHEFESRLSELESHIRGLFANPHIIPGTLALAEIPVIGGLYIVDQPQLIPILLPRICAALCARERFRQDAPDWAPPLPLRREDWEALEDDDNHRFNLVGYYGDSLEGESWNYDVHPRFDIFCRGLMAYPSTPAELRNDRELRREFPPRRLAGLCDGRLDWRSSERIASDREHQARCAALDAARAAIAAP